MNSLATIKQILTAMESQVEGDDVDALQSQIAGFATRFRDNRHAASLVKMIQAVAGYLGSQADAAHPDSVPLLRSLVEQLEILVQSPGTTSEAADGILARAVESFKDLKSKIAAVPLVSERDIESLKAVILSIDWEISDTTLENFDAVVNRLMAKVKAHKIHASFLKIIYSIGGYVARNKAGAHRNSIGLLRSAFQSYERLVRNPDMAAAEKKQMLELEIRRFHTFKHELGRSPAPGAGDEGVMPALSHVKASPSTAPLAPLSKLTESAAPACHGSGGDDDIPPALAGRKKAPVDSRDMMDDLFTAKGSASDDLLDAIHLGGIHGPGQGPGMEMFGTEDGRDHQEGVKQFTPQRGEREPIPEIESRLDEFFNLELTEGKKPPAVQAVEVEMDDEPGPEAVVPFQYEDELFVEDEDEQYQVPVVLQRLKAALTPDGGLLTDPAVLTDFMGDVALLKSKWQDDSDKAALLDMLASFAQHVHQVGKGHGSASLDDDPALSAENQEKAGAVDSAEPPARGVWARLKSLFSHD